jgi:hypothetical protein
MVSAGNQELKSKNILDFIEYHTAWLVDSE